MSETRQQELREFARVVLEEQSAILAEQREQIVKAAVAASLAAWGINVTDEEELREIKLDRVHTRKMRKSIEAVQRVSLLTAVSTLVAGIVGGLMLVFKVKFGS